MIAVNRENRDSDVEIAVLVIDSWEAVGVALERRIVENGIDKRTKSLRLYPLQDCLRAQSVPVYHRECILAEGS